MPTETLGAALEREHREIDAALDDYAASIAAGEPRSEPLLAAIGALRRHIYLEEAMLFPALRAGGFVAPVFVMVREHAQIWRAMDELEAGADGSRTPEDLLDVCRVLAEQLEAHNTKEEAILYPRAEDVLTAEGNSELHAFIAAGAMPEGWVCEGMASGGARFVP